MIHRAKLHDRITDQFGPSITVRTGFTVTGVDQEDSAATVSGAGEQLRADLVVAADGIRSTVRTALHRQYPGPQYAGYTSYRGLAELDTDDGGGETWVVADGSGSRGSRMAASTGTRPPTSRNANRGTSPESGRRSTPGTSRFLRSWLPPRSCCRPTSTTCHYRWSRSSRVALCCWATPRTR